jgi:serine/threonine-protein phosphatase 2A activator
MRVLQASYWLEPAGSHGVWGLDDYHFLPFLFGAAQLRGHKYIRPRAIHDADVVAEYAREYMYFACIQFINSVRAPTVATAAVLTLRLQVKTASLRWHSPMLDDISAVKTWDKVNAGMQKMYAAEVLGKLPVMQHFLFGSLLRYTGPPPPSSPADHGHEGHAHGPRTVHPKVTNGLAPPPDGAAAGQAAGWGDCCGIPVPSVFGAAAQAERVPGALLAGPGIRPVPFD